MKRAEQGLTKDGAVRCSFCKSCDIEAIEEPREVQGLQKSAAIEETFRCRSCGRRFSKAV
jgi:hypothetical protein